MNQPRVDELQLAPPSRRLPAFLIDIVIIFVINLTVLISLGTGEEPTRTALATVLALTAAYNIGFVALKSATPGKMAMGLYVGDREGKAVRPDTAILRFLTLFLVGNVTIGIGTLISAVLILTDRERRALHDRVAGTRVWQGQPPEPERSYRDGFPRI